MVETTTRKSTATCNHAISIVALALCAFFLLLSMVNLRRDSQIEAIDYVSSVLQKHDINATYYSTKWIVITSIHAPTQDIKFLDSIPGWQLLVVGDKKSPKNFSCNNCIFLSVEAQRNLQYNILKHLSYNCYCRKMIGYLYAIEHGARTIYDTDDDNRPIKRNFENYFELEEYRSGLFYRPKLIEKLSYRIMNPFAHFGQPMIWPRGYPLIRIFDKNAETYESCGRLPTPLIQQGMIDFDPDVDAIYRLTHEEFVNAKPNISFDARAPPFALPSFVFAPFNTQNTVFRYDAFWALYLPISVAFRVTDIWRGYWAQRLLWLIGGRIGFYPTSARQIRNKHSYMNDFREEFQLYNQSSELLTVLTSYSCRLSKFYDCIVDLSVVMAQHKFWDKQEVEVLNAWLVDLENIGYVAPRLYMKLGDECLADSKPVIYKPSQYVTSNDISLKQSVLDLRLFCSWNDSVNSNVTASKRFAKLGYYYNTVLIITFNFPMYDLMSLLNSLYSPFFRQIIFCGAVPSQSDILNRTLTTFSKVTFIQLTEADMSNGAYHYYCTAKAMHMNFKGIDGYLSISDDLIVNAWFKLNKTVVNSYLPCRRDPAKYASTGMSLASQRLVKNLTEILKNSSHYLYDSVRKILRIEHNVSLENAFAILSNDWKCISDINFIPSSQAQLYDQIAPLFKENEMFLEYAVPKMLWGLGWDFHANATTVVGRIPGKYLWAAWERSSPMSFYDVENMFVHPVKLRQVTQDSKLRSNFCAKYIADVLNFIT